MTFSQVVWLIGCWLVSASHKARLFGWSAADWSRPATNKSISSERKRKGLAFCWERKPWTLTNTGCWPVAVKRVGLLRSPKKSINKKEKCFLSSQTCRTQSTSKLKSTLVKNSFIEKRLWTSAHTSVTHPTCSACLLCSLLWVQKVIGWAVRWCLARNMHQVVQGRGGKLVMPELQLTYPHAFPLHLWQIRRNL